MCIKGSFLKEENEDRTDFLDSLLFDFVFPTR